MVIDNIPGVYAIINTINGKRYVGSSFDVGRRLAGHKSALRHNKHQNEHLQRAWNKYGEGAFEYEIIETCLVNELVDLEQKWMDDTDIIAKGYNICPIASSTLGRKCTEKHKENIRQAHLGHPVSDESREKMSKAKIGKPNWFVSSKKGDTEYWESVGFTWKGKKHSEESKKKMSESLKGRVPPNKGKPMHENARSALYKANKGRKHSEEHNRKIGESNRGITRNQKIPESDLYKIKELHETGKYSQREIADMFGVHQSAISRIINGKSRNIHKNTIPCH